MSAISPNAAGPELRSYHGQPVIKEPIWTWEIPVYFFTGGMAGAGAALAYLSHLRGNETLARRAWAVALVGNTASPLLLISDLGKPMRAMNMFRMVKVTSPMSIGSWILLASGNATGISTANAWLGWFPRLSRLTRPAAALIGMPLSTYTGALIANTAVPVWHEARRTLPFVFGAGAALSAGAAAAVLTPVESAAPARRLALAGALLEAGLKRTMENQLGELGEPYEQGPGARYGNLAHVCLAGGSLLLARRGSRSRLAAGAGGALLLGGALAARWSVFRAGFQSAADPKQVVGPQRTAIERGERRGASRREARVREPDPAVGSPAILARG